MSPSSNNKPPGKVWIQQASSDYRCAEYLLTSQEEYLRCHIIAKCQQTVEKSIKGVLSALGEADIEVSEPSYFSHTVDKHINVLFRLPDTHKNKSIQGYISSVLNTPLAGAAAYKRVNDLCNLAPKGQTAERNTEYPFQKNDGTWTAPAESDTFSEKELDEFCQTARHIFLGSQKIVDALSRGKFRRIEP